MILQKNNSLFMLLLHLLLHRVAVAIFPIAEGTFYMPLTTYCIFPSTKLRACMLPKPVFIFIPFYAKSAPQYFTWYTTLY